VQITEEAEELVRLTEEQFWVLDFLGRHRRAAICGCAGSGKTLLAAEKARRLIRQGFHVLLTCFNRYLAEFLKASLVPNDGLHVAHFHGLCTEWARRAGILVGSPSEQDRQRFFDEILPEQLLDAVDCLGPQYDAIVVDEGQDFRENWWVPLQCLLHDPDAGILYVFFDDNQNLYQAEPSILLPIAPYPLTHNCRNTRRIHGTVSRFYRADHPTVARGPEGRPVDVRIYTDVAGLKRHLRKVLHQLVMEDGVPASDIIVLTPRKRERSALWQFGLLGNFRLTDQPTGGHGDVFCTTVHAFKGLESPVVVLAEVEPEASKDLETVLYVGCSRARHHLIILASADLPGETRERLG
jgi:superfamily I DNA/RNA helicase